MKINSLCLQVMIYIIIIISTSQIQAYADNTSPMTLAFNHTKSLEKQLSLYYLNDTQTAIAINLAKSSTQFQSAVKGYNYTFNSIADIVGPSPQGGYALIGYSVVFDLYRGLYIPCEPAGRAEVFENSVVTKVLNVTTHGPIPCLGASKGGIVSNPTTVPEFPIGVPILVISFVSLGIFYRIKIKF